MKKIYTTTAIGVFCSLVIAFSTYRYGVIEARQHEYVVLAMNKAAGARNKPASVYDQDFFVKGGSKTADLFMVKYVDGYAETTTALRSTGKKETFINLAHPGKDTAIHDVVISEFRGRKVVRGIYYTTIEGKPVAFVRQKELREILFDNSSIFLLPILTALFLMIGVVMIRRRDRENNRVNVHLNTLFDSIKEGLITITKRGIITTANPATTSLFGYSMDELIGSNVSILMPEPHRSEHDEYLMKYLKTGNKKIIGIGRDDLMAARKDKTQFPIHLTVTEMVMPDGEIKFAGVIRDLTKDAEQKKYLKKNNEQFRAISSMFKHDLAGALGYIQTGLDELKRVLTIEQQKELRLDAAIELIEAGAVQQYDRMKGATAFLEVARHGGKISKKTFNADEAIKASLKTTDYGDAVNVSDLGNVSANKELFLNAIDNLVRNGILHNSKPSKWVKIYLKDEAIVIEDNGNGFNEGQFEELCKFGTRASEAEGTGFGLNIVKNTVEQHDWRLSAESKIGEGTKIFIHLN